MLGLSLVGLYSFFFFQAEDGIRDYKVTGVQTCALPICVAALLECARAGRVSGRVEVRPDEERRPPRVAPGHPAHDVVVRASPKRERCEVHAEAERGQLARDVVAGGPMSLGGGARVADALERGDVTPQPFREARALTGG